MLYYLKSRSVLLKKTFAPSPLMRFAAYKFSLLEEKKFFPK